MKDEDIVVQTVAPAQIAARAAEMRYSPAVRVGHYLHVAGHVGWTGEMTMDPDPAVQARQAFDNVADTLSVAGATWSDVIEMNTFHVGLQGNLAEFALIRAEFVTEPYPAWTAIGVAELALPGILVEIAATAVLRG